MIFWNHPKRTADPLNWWEGGKELYIVGFLNLLVPPSMNAINERNQWTQSMNAINERNQWTTEEYQLWFIGSIISSASLFNPGCPWLIKTSQILTKTSSESACLKRLCNSSNIILALSYREVPLVVLTLSIVESDSKSLAQSSVDNFSGSLIRSSSRGVYCFRTLKAAESVVGWEVAHLLDYSNRSNT